MLLSVSAPRRLSFGLPRGRPASRGAPFRAGAQQLLTPHSGYHWDGDRGGRFFEGWYWKVMMPEVQDSFAIIFSIEDPQGNKPGSGVGIQVMGPRDTYICQSSRNTGTFWAAKDKLELGAALKTSASGRPPKGMLPQAAFDSAVEHGFQASHTWHQGSIVSQEAGLPGKPLSTVPSCSWAFQLNPVYGWGPASGPQQPTAGWLSVISLFEPHWQVLMAHGTASGWLQWGDKRYEFRDAPAYGEKNWGAGFPSKWHWVQCNSFDDQSQLSVTAVGAKRALVTGLPVLGAVGEEEVGLIGIHHNGQFYEFVPQNAEVEWDVDPWGRWWIRARNGTHEALIEATADAPGAVLRAPTPRDGLAAVCRDTFFGRCRLRLWPLGANRLPVPGATPIVDALSSTAALEVGGGPWFTNWSASARMAEPVKALLGLPIDVVGLKNLTPPPLRPPGL